MNLFVFLLVFLLVLLFSDSLFKTVGLILILIVFYNIIKDQSKMKLIAGDNIFLVIGKSLLLMVPMLILLSPGVGVAFAIHRGIEFGIDFVNGSISGVIKDPQGGIFDPAKYFTMLINLIMSPVVLAVGLICKFLKLILSASWIIIVCWISFVITRSFLLIFGRCAIRHGYNSRFSIGVK